eukprot:TRINITY_DN25224_c0_g1_i1.p1 TRINITY_DN25224_c0_g1~~TRINITY_DN25224_c0_g1_i1.p1  ORF type:complete len:497 (+),score=90.21 TRINITY_DN25224_c0_g1_i1:32-1492(+)
MSTECCSSSSQSSNNYHPTRTEDEFEFDREDGMRYRKRPKTNLLQTLFQRESCHKRAAVRSHGKSVAVNQARAFREDVINATSDISRKSLARKLPWHHAEDRFESAMSGGFRNFYGRAYPMATQFSKQACNGHLLAIGCETGKITLVDTTTEQNLETGVWDFVDQVRLKIPVHKNTIYDLTWNRNDTEIVTASADQLVSILDVETGTVKTKLSGHFGSVKCVSAHPDHPDIVVSATRDGMILIHDTREQSVKKSENGEIGVHRSLMRAHEVPRPKTDQKKKRVRAGTSGSITGVKFIPGTMQMLSCGATDGFVKLWDIRADKLNSRCMGQLNPCKRDNCSRIHGIHSLDITSDASRVLVGARNSKVYVYESANLLEGEFMTLTGHTSRTFYVRSKFTPEGTHVISGSSDYRMYLWQVEGSSKSSDPVKVFDFHNGEINGIDGCSTEMGKFASCSDDSTVQVWTTTDDYVVDDSDDERHAPVDSSWF